MVHYRTLDPLLREAISPKITIPDTLHAHLASLVDRAWTPDGHRVLRIRNLCFARNVIRRKTPVRYPWIFHSPPTQRRGLGPCRGEVEMQGRTCQTSKVVEVRKTRVSIGVCGNTILRTTLNAMTLSRGTKGNSPDESSPCRVLTNVASSGITSSSCWRSEGFCNQ